MGPKCLVMVRSLASANAMLNCLRHGMLGTCTFTLLDCSGGSVIE